MDAARGRRLPARPRDCMAREAAAGRCERLECICGRVAATIRRWPPGARLEYASLPPLRLTTPID